MLISAARLTGTAPKIDPDLLPDGAHQIAENVRFDSGAAEPWNAPLAVATPTKDSSVQTIYRYGADVVGDADYWLNLLGAGNIVPGPIADDVLERVYFTEAGQPPKMTRSDIAIGAELPNATRLLGLPIPDVSGVTATPASRAVTSITRSGTTATITFSSAIEFETGEQFQLVVTGATQTEYNGEFLATVTGASTATYTVSGSPATPATGAIKYHFGGVYEDRVFVVCFVGDGDEIGPASDPITCRVAPGQTVALASLPITVTWADRSGTTVVTDKRIYQSIGSGYALDGTVSLATTSYTSTGVPTSQTFLPDFIALPPPADLFGLKAIADGPMIGLSGDKDVCVSERNFPHAWPTEYRLTVDYKHVGVGVFGHSAVVLTTAYPYLITGTDPRALTMTRMQTNQACVSARSIADAGFGVFYASPDGLVLVGDSGAQVVTEALMTRREWQSIEPSSLLGVFHEGRYYGFYQSTYAEDWVEDGYVAGADGDFERTIGNNYIDLDYIEDYFGEDGAEGCFIYTHATGELIWSSVHASAAYADPRTDGLYLVVGGSIVRWDDGPTTLTGALKSKRYRMRRHNLGAAKVIADTYPVVFRYYADGALKLDKIVSNDFAFRLPAGFRPDYVEVELEFTGRVLPPMLASSLAELA